MWGWGYKDDDELSDGLKKKKNLLIKMHMFKKKNIIQ